MKKVLVSELVGKNAISMQSGGKLYDKIYPILILGESLVLSFDGVSLYASPFFNASIGLMLKDLAVENLQRQVKIEGISEVGRSLLNHVIENAITYYKNKENISKGIDNTSVYGDSDD